MPDRELIAHHPVRGMVFHYARGKEPNVSHWVIMIDKITPNKLVWLWAKGAKTWEEAMNRKSWNEQTDYDHDDWKEWLLNISSKWGTTHIELLSEKATPTWEV